MVVKDLLVCLRLCANVYYFNGYLWIFSIKAIYSNKHRTSQEQVALIETLDDKLVRSQAKIERWTDEMNRLMKGEDVRVDNQLIVSKKN